MLNILFLNREINLNFFNWLNVMQSIISSNNGKSEPNIPRNSGQAKIWKS
jgi:hypothetical protein